MVPSHLVRTGNRYGDVGPEGEPEFGECIGILFVALSPSLADGVFGGGAVEQGAGPVTEMKEEPDFCAWGGVGDVNAFILCQLQRWAELALAGGHVCIEKHPDVIVVRDFAIASFAAVSARGCCVSLLHGCPDEAFRVGTARMNDSDGDRVDLEGFAGRFEVHSLSDLPFGNDQE